jgi:serine/threonine protein kinase
MNLKPGNFLIPKQTDYELIRKLGTGAFGEVWRARGPGGFDVALKIIHLNTFVRTVELRSLDVMKNIRHPNLVSLFGYWQRDNYLFVVMELCDRTLQDRLAESLKENQPGIPPAELLNYMSDAAQGLDALNSQQVQHRDVKPANLLLLGSSVKVADFGLAKVLEETVGSNTGAGTLAYTAPECFRGELTQQSDQYSLAVTYYQLRTGQLLFNGNQAEVMYAHLESEPDLSRLPETEKVVLTRALSKDPSERWGNCTAFVNELRTSIEKLKSYEARQAGLPVKSMIPPRFSPSENAIEVRLDRGSGIFPIFGCFPVTFGIPAFAISESLSGKFHYDTTTIVVSSIFALLGLMGFCMGLKPIVDRRVKMSITSHGIFDHRTGNGVEWRDLRGIRLQRVPTTHGYVSASMYITKEHIQGSGVEVFFDLNNLDRTCEVIAETVRERANAAQANSTSA